MNRSLLIRIAMFAVLATGLGAGWWYIDKTYFPKPETKPPNPPRESVLALTGIAATATSPADIWPWGTAPEPPKPKAVEPVKPTPPVVPAPESKPTDPTILIALGNADCFQQILLTNRGAAIQQAILPKFDESTRGGRDAKAPSGNNRRLHLIPGFHGLTKGTVERSSIFDENAYPILKAGEFKPGTVALAPISYELLHYPSIGDPLRQGEDSDTHPSEELAKRLWKIVERSETKVVFETSLAAPYFLKITKTFTLDPRDYHLGMKLDFEALPGRPTDKDRARFKYQISGARNLPIEGEWYTSTYRNAITGWVTATGTAKRDIQDSATITTSHGAPSQQFGGAPSALAPGWGDEVQATIELGAALEAIASRAVGPLGAASIRARRPALDLDWIRTELARVGEIAALFRTGEGLAAEAVPLLAPAAAVFPPNQSRSDRGAPESARP